MFYARGDNKSEAVFRLGMPCH